MADEEDGIKPEDLPSHIREQIERFMGDRERCMPSERVALERKGFKATLDRPKP